MTQVKNNQVVLRNYVTDFPKESDMNIVESVITLKLPQGSNDVLLKNLYLSCDPYMRMLMTKVEGLDVFGTYTPGSVSHQFFFSQFHLFYFVIFTLFIFSFLVITMLLIANIIYGILIDFVSLSRNMTSYF